MDRLYLALVGVQDRIVARWRQARARLREWHLCWRGHSYVLHVEPPDRMYLRCEVCDRCSHGWGRLSLPAHRGDR